MKRNRTMSAAVFMLVATLITSCFVGGTFAKYTTSVDGTATARVARWGLNTTGSEVTLTDLFSTAYNSNEVKSSNSDKVIAPGTTGEGTFTFKYEAGKAPEVDYTLSIDTSESVYPDALNGVLEWSLDGTKCGTNGTFVELQTAIKALSGDASGSKDYDAGQLPTSLSSDQHTISWKWAINPTTPKTDADDTVLGNKAALDTVTVKIKLSATQKSTAS